jgi:ribosomal protein S18 acetylase RimI-like enzyme
VIHSETVESAAGKLVIRPAIPIELHTVMAILSDAADWLKTKGIDQWQSPPPLALWDFMAREIEVGHIYLVQRQTDSAALATFRLTWIDAELWDDAHGRANAGYVYTLATSAQAKGTGLGKKILSWIGGYVGRQGKSRLRLDCMANNPAIRAYYTRLGFEYRGQKTTHDGYTLALYELRLDGV